MSGSVSVWEYDVVAELCLASCFLKWLGASAPRSCFESVLGSCRVVALLSPVPELLPMIPVLLVGATVQSKLGLDGVTDASGSGCC